MLSRVPRSPFDWRLAADWAKRREWPLRVADRLGRGRGRLRPFEPGAGRADLTALATADLAACWVGHATTLLRVGGRTVLTDPVFSDRVGFDFGLFTAGPRRMTRAAIDVNRLPAADLIVVSHAHFDHLDRPSLWRLSRRFRGVPVACAAGTADLLGDLFDDVRELAWGESAELGGVRATAVPVAHWGPRVFHDRWRGYAAFLLERGGNRVLFGGDTAHTDAWRGLGPVDLLCVGIGAYDPYVAAHATPEQAWAMAELVAARRVMAMHHSTFRLSREPFDEPLRRFLAAAGEGAGRVVCRGVGEVWGR